jgi:hypothetical protein
MSKENIKMAGNTNNYAFKCIYFLVIAHALNPQFMSSRTEKLINSKPSVCVFTNRKNF